MAEAEGIPPTASAVSAGQSIIYLGDYAWCYTGGIGVNATLTTVLETQTASGLMVANMQLTYVTVSANDQMEWQIYLNDILMAGAKDVSPTHYTEFNFPLKLVLPPFTKIKVTCDNVSQDVSRDMAVLLTGRVYDV